MTWLLVGAGVVLVACLADALSRENDDRSVTELFFADASYFAAFALIVWGGSAFFG